MHIKRVGVLWVFVYCVHANHGQKVEHTHTDAIVLFTYTIKPHSCTDMCVVHCAYNILCIYLVYSYYTVQQFFYINSTNITISLLYIAHRQTSYIITTKRHHSVHKPVNALTNTDACYRARLTQNFFFFASSIHRQNRICIYRENCEFPTHHGLLHIKFSFCQISLLYTGRLYSSKSSIVSNILNDIVCFI